MQSSSDITSPAYCANKVNISFDIRTLVFLDEGFVFLTLSHHQVMAKGPVSLLRPAHKSDVTRN